MKVASMIEIVIAPRLATGAKVSLVTAPRLAWSNPRTIQTGARRGRARDVDARYRPPQSHSTRRVEGHPGPSGRCSGVPADVGRPSPNCRSHSRPGEVRR